MGREGMTGVEVVRRGKWECLRKEVEGWSRRPGNLRIFFLYRALDFLHRERKMQLHVPSQPFQASVVCKNEGVVVGFVPCGGPRSILYANKRLFCILTAVWWQGSARGAAAGECGALAM